MRVCVTRSAGQDGAVLVFVDTDFEPDASDDGPGLRVFVNDDEVYVGKPYELWDGPIQHTEPRPAHEMVMEFPMAAISYKEG